MDLNSIIIAERVFQFTKWDLYVCTVYFMALWASVLMQS